jgi:S-adenosylmethionine:tRNA ribosyltransferase-isomerase
MRIKDFDYDLPEELIAQHALDNRDEARLLVLENINKIIDSYFYNLHEFLDEGDLLVLNDSKVIKAHLTLIKDKSEISINLNKNITNRIWTGFAKPAKKLSVGDSFGFGNSKIIVKDKGEDGLIYFEFDLEEPLTIHDFLDVYGSIPLPPYIKDGVADPEDEDHYQTIYSKNEGSVAAPTAGLHFSDNVFVNLKKKNIDCCFVTLHVGAGTYLPVKEEIDKHVMHSEYAHITEDTANLINNAKKEGRKIVAVGTTSTRTLEHSAKNDGIVHSGSFETDLFIKPGFEFKIVDKLITNFHLPKSTLMLLVSAFAGYDEIIKAYSHAKEKKYRFLSYGDAMLLRRKI